MLAARAIAAVQSKLKEKKKNAKRIKAELSGIVRSHDTFLQEFQAQTDDLDLGAGGEDAHLYKVLPVFLDTAQYKAAGEEEDGESAKEKMYRKVFEQADADGEARTPLPARARASRARGAKLGRLSSSPAFLQGTLDAPELQKALKRVGVTVDLKRTQQMVRAPLARARWRA